MANARHLLLVASLALSAVAGCIDLDLEVDDDVSTVPRELTAAPTRTFHIRNVGTGMCLDSAATSHAGDPILLQRCSTVDSTQNWVVVADGTIGFRNERNGLMIAYPLEPGSTALLAQNVPQPGMEVSVLIMGQWTDDGHSTAPDQLQTLLRYCFDVGSVAGDAVSLLTVNTCRQGAAAQQWVLDEVVPVRFCPRRPLSVQRCGLPGLCSERVRDCQCRCNRAAPPNTAPTSVTGRLQQLERQLGKCFEVIEDGCSSFMSCSTRANTIT